jgi:hypothetical protein
MVGHLIAEVAACGDAERDDLCQTPRKVRLPATPDLPVYVDDRKLLQLASSPARGKPALQPFTGWAPLPGLTEPGVCREAGTCP